MGVHKAEGGGAAGVRGKLPPGVTATTITETLDTVHVVGKDGVLNIAAVRESVAAPNRSAADLHLGRHPQIAEVCPRPAIVAVQQTAGRVALTQQGAFVGNNSLEFGRQEVVHAALTVIHLFNGGVFARAVGHLHLEGVQERIQMGTQPRMLVTLAGHGDVVRASGGGIIECDGKGGGIIGVTRDLIAAHDDVVDAVHLFRQHKLGLAAVAGQLFHGNQTIVEVGEVVLNVRRPQVFGDKVDVMTDLLIAVLVVGVDARHDSHDAGLGAVRAVERDVVAHMDAVEVPGLDAGLNPLPHTGVALDFLRELQAQIHAGIAVVGIHAEEKALIAGCGVKDVVDKNFVCHRCCTSD